MLDTDVKGLLELADGDSGLNGKFREGLVFKSLSDPEFSFKAISNRYLLKNGKIRSKNMIERENNGATLSKVEVNASGGTLSIKSVIWIL